MSTPRESSLATSTPTDPLDRLRGLRVRPDRARGLAGELEVQMKSMKKISDSESAALDAWGTVVPDAIGDCCSVGGLKAGKLVVMVENASQRHVVDRWLASGGFRTFQALARVPIRGIELKIAPQTPKL
jgi:Dna[CI] antecedent, DciA